MGFDRHGADEERCRYFVVRFPACNEAKYFAFTYRQSCGAVLAGTAEPIDTRHSLIVGRLEQAFNQRFMTCIRGYFHERRERAIRSHKAVEMAEFSHE
jgi:hypothetical protein